MSSNLPPENPNKDRLPIDSKIDHASSIRYWNEAPATANAMLGNLGDFPWYSRIDLQGSANFLAEARRLMKIAEKKFRAAVDCGAGVGRVTEGFLRHVCGVVDAVEPVEKFTSVLGEKFQDKEVDWAGDIYVTGLESWKPVKKYDWIWCQWWCAGHIKHAQLTDFLIRCRAALSENGIMVVKENISTDPNGEDMYDDLDSSFTRSNEKFRQIFKYVQMNVIMSEVQSGFPKKYKALPVRPYALRPMKT